MAWSGRPAAPAGGRVLAESDDAILDRIELLSNMPTAHLRQTSAQTLTTGVTTAILFGVEDIDTHGGHSTVSNTSRYTCQVAGTYQLSGYISWASSIAGARKAWWRRNGSDINGSESVADSDITGVIGTVARTILVDLSVGDYVELVGTQESGGNLATSVTATQQPTMSVRMTTPAA